VGAGQLAQLKGLPFTSSRDNHFLLSDARKYFDTHQDVKKSQKEVNDGYSENPDQDKYPVIVIKSRDELVVLDGNRRTLRAILSDQRMIEAWIATSDGKAPKDYWLPLGHMMSLVSNFAFAQENNTYADLDSYRNILKSWFEQSEVARINFKHRISNQHLKYVDELSKGLL
jgi:hypothetical protein